MEYHSRSDHLAKPPQRTANYAERFALQVEAEGYGSGSLSFRKMSGSAPSSASGEALADLNSRMAPCHSAGQSSEGKARPAAGNGLKTGGQGRKIGGTARSVGVPIF